MAEELSGQAEQLASAVGFFKVDLAKGAAAEGTPRASAATKRTASLEKSRALALPASKTEGRAVAKTAVVDSDFEEF